MPITTLPALSRTATTFKADVDTFFGTQLPAFATEANALEDNVNAKEASAVSSAATATTKAGEASASAAAALASQNSASASAAAAATEADEAFTSAASASGSATTATTKAAEAAASAASVVRDGSGGVAGLTLFKLNLRNAANTVTSFLTNAATAARTWTMPDKDGTVAMTSDFAAPGPIGGTTPSTVAATTLSATGKLTVGAKAILEAPAWDTGYLALRHSALAETAATSALFQSAGGSTFLNSVAGQSLYLGINGAVVGALTSTGLAVTGGLSATSDLTLSATDGKILGGTAAGRAIWGNAGTSAYIVAYGASHATLPNQLNFVANGNTMALDASGNLLVGAASGSYHVIQKAGTNADGAVILGITPGTNTGAVFYGSSAIGGFGNAANAILRIGAASAGRSINAAGTVNASGADYAEYEHNNGLTIAKGSIVGFKADGTLTSFYAEATRFAIKSTNPSYVGGDTWGAEDKVGKRPEEPQRIPDKTEQHLVSETVQAVVGVAAHLAVEAAPAEYTTVTTEEVVLVDGVETVITRCQLVETKAAVATQAAIEAVAAVEAQEAVYETIITEAGDTDAEWVAKQAAYETYKLEFEARLESARVQVDRIAYSGKVPCNVLGAVPGGYIIAVDSEGAIAGEFVADPDFAQYKKAVGRVNRILEDGRCEVAVILH